MNGTGLDALAAEWLRVLWKASWEGSVAFMIAWLLCALLPGTSGNLRCWVWRLAFVKLLVALLLWQPIDLPLLRARPETTAGGSSTASRQRPTADGIRSLARPPSAGQSPEESFAMTGPASGAAQPAPLGAAAWGLGVWVLGIAVCGGRLVVQGRHVDRWRRGCEVIDEPRLTALLAEQCGRFGISRAPALLAHPAYGPLLLGGSAPAIVLPAALLRSASDAELRMVFAHELAHLKRRDLFWSSVAAVAQILFFFHPLVRLGRRQYRLAQEMACDELTVRATGASTRAYAELLLKVATGHGAERGSFAALGVLGSGISLDRRITLLQQLGRRSRRQTTWAATVATGIALVGLAPWRVVAQTTTPAPETPTTKAPAGETKADTPGVDIGEVGVAWEDMLLLQATRYLRLSPSQLQQLLPVARTANRRLTELQVREDKVLESLRRIALRQRDALVAGRSGSAQEQADAIALREGALRARSETERVIVDSSLAELARLLAPKQVERAFLLQQGQTPEAEAREPALLDPAAGFVTGAFDGGSGFGVRSVGGPRKPGAPDGQPSLAQQLLQAQLQLSMLQRHLSEPFPTGAVGGGVFARQSADGKPPMVLRFSTSPGFPPPPLPPGVTGPDVPDATAFKQHLTDEMQALTKQVGDLRRRLFTANGDTPPEQYEALLRPLAQRLFLSPRFPQAVENRLHPKN